MTYYRRNLLILSLTSFMAACSLYQIIPFLPFFIRELGIKDHIPMWTGLILALQGVATVVMMPFWGKVADKYGRKLMIIRAGICLALIYAGMSVCKTFWPFFILRVCNGIFTGFLPSSITLVATNSPKEESARHVSVIQSMIAFGGIAGPSIGSFLAGWIGIRNSMMFTAGVVGLAVLLVYLFVEERNKVTGEASKTSLWQDFGVAFRMPVLVTALLADMTVGLVTMASEPILVLHVQQIAGKAANWLCGPIYSLPGLAILLTNYTWCRIGEQRTFQKIIVLGLVGMSVFTILQGFTSNVWLFAGLYFLAGIFEAAVSPNTAALVTTHVDADFKGRAFGIQQSSSKFGSLVAPILSGVIGSFISYRWVFIIVGMLSMIMMAAVRIQMRPWVLKETKPLPKTLVG